MANRRRPVVALRSAVKRLRQAPKWRGRKLGPPKWVTARGPVARFRRGRREAAAAATLPVGQHRYERPVVLQSADGRFEIRITRDPSDIDEAQELRYRVFYEQMDAVPSDEIRGTRRDADAFDSICDHILVRDMTRDPGDRVVGTYRMLRYDVAQSHGGFYSADEYDLSPILNKAEDQRGLCELGRSSVHVDYRNNATIQLLWRGLAQYFAANETTRMIGCASFAGTDPAAHALPLSYLYHFHLAPESVRVQALPERFASMNLMAKKDIDPRQALRQMPPLIKAYLRLGATLGDGAVIDHQFHTTDIFITVEMATVPQKYHAHFEREAALRA